MAPWKPGQSGNPAGRPLGSRNRFSEDFLRDFHEMWLALGRPALETMAMMNPAEFVRAAVALVPKEMHATITKINASRLSDAELDALIEREIRAAPEQEAAQEDTQVLQ
jgi:Family of unknown function (DUF5681)